MKKRDKRIGSRRALELWIAAVVIAAPTVLNFFSARAAVLLLSLCMSLLFVWRLVDTRRIYCGVAAVLAAALSAWSLLSMAWAYDRSANLHHTLLCLCCLLFVLLAADYMTELRAAGRERNLMWMIFLGGALCAAWNVIYWLLYALPSMENYRFMAGIGSPDLLGIFLYSALLCSLFLSKSASKQKRVWMRVAMGWMLFCLIMTQSSRAFLFCALFTAVTVAYSRERIGARLARLLYGLSGAVGAASLFFCVRSLRDASGASFGDAFLAGIRRVVGLGGGGFLSDYAAVHTADYAPQTVPTLASLTASYGVIGLILAVLAAVWVLYLAVRHRGYASVITAALVVYALFVPLADSAAALLFLLGMTASLEERSGACRVIEIPVRRQQVCAAVALVMFVCAAYLSFCHITARNGALHFAAGEYAEAYRFYTAAAAMNPLAGDAAYGAAQSAFERERAQETKQYADALGAVSQAVQRERHNVTYQLLEASIYYEAGQYAPAAAMWEEIASSGERNRQYYVNYAQALLAQIQTMERGSDEARALYDEMVKTADRATNLDEKKLINDAVDAAQPYARADSMFENEQAGVADAIIDENATAAEVTT